MGLDRQGLVISPRTLSWGRPGEQFPCVTHQGHLGGSDTQDVARSLRRGRKGRRERKKQGGRQEGSKGAREQGRKANLAPPEDKSPHLSLFPPC